MYLKKVRKISKNELIYLDMQDISTSFAIQFVFKYEKPVDIEQLEYAIQKTKMDIPDCFVKKYKNYWIQNEDTIKIRSFNLDLDEMFASNIFFEKMDYTKHTFEVLYIQNRGNYYLVFKFSHSVVDGKGALLILDNIFANLKQEGTVKCSNLINDEEFIHDLDCKNVSLPLLKNYHLKNDFSKGSRVVYKILKYPKIHHGIIAKLAIIFTNFFKEQKVRFMIPVDIRWHKNSFSTVANLVLPIFLDVDKKDDFGKVYEKFLFKLKNNHALNKNSVNHFLYDKYPKKIRHIALKVLFTFKEFQKSFSIGAILSHLGRIDLERYSFRDNHAISFCSLPVQQKLAPFSVVISETQEETTIALSYFEEQIDKNTIHKIEQKCNQTFLNLVDYSFNDTNLVLVPSLLNTINTVFKNNLNKVAIIDDIRQYSYKELLEKSKKIAHILEQNNINYQDKVILYMERSFDFIASLLAVLMRGAVYLPIDKTEADFRIEQIIDNSSAKVLLTNIKNVNFSNINTVNLNIVEEFNVSDCNFFNYNKNDEIYNIFTSGTTGIPKGIKVTVKNLENYIFWAKNTYKCKEKLIMPLFTSLSVDLTVTSVFLPLVSGGIIVIFNENFSGRVLEKIYSNPNINIVKCTPTHLVLLKEKKYKSKEWLIVGGENFKSLLIPKLEKNHKNIVNEYGPAEATVGTIYYVYDKNSVLPDKLTVPIGFPVANTKIYLVDENNDIIKNNNIYGEIIIVGSSVADGYINNDSNNGFKFLNNEKCYYTGDIGIFDDSLLYCIGRKDEQIKINGQRVELEEISSCFMTMNDIKSSETFFINGQLVSFIILKNKISKEKIIEYLKVKLPHFAIPKHICIVDNFPVLANGKIDKKSLIEKLNLAPEDGLDDIKLLIKEKIPDKIFDFKYEKLYDIGLDSMDMLVLEQEIAEKYLKFEVREKFFRDYIKNTAFMTITDVKNLIESYGGKI